MTGNDLTNSSGDSVQIRELHTLLNQMKTEILSEVKGMNSNMERRIEQVDTEVNAKFDVHKVEHDREHDHRSQLWRWSVTTIVIIILGIAGFIVQFVIKFS